MTTPWLPDGFHTITPNIIAADAEQAVSFLKRAFGATENYRLTLSDGKITHCELRIGDSVINLGTAMEGWPARGLIAQIFVETPDTLFERAVQAGATVMMPMTDMFFGIREGRVSDPFGNVWIIATLRAFDPRRDAAEAARGRLLNFGRHLPELGRADGDDTHTQPG